MNEPITIHQALAAVMSEMGAIGKHGKNQQQGYAFRGIEDVYNALHPVFAKHGVKTVPTVVNREFYERKTAKGSDMFHTVLTVDFAFIGPAGDFITARVLGEAMDTGDKSSNKAMTAAHKYALVQTLCISFTDMQDADRTTPDETKREQISTLDLSSKSKAPVKPPIDLDKFKTEVRTAKSVTDLAGMWRKLEPAFQEQLKDLFNDRKDQLTEGVVAE